MYSVFKPPLWYIQWWDCIVFVFFIYDAFQWTTIFKWQDNLIYITNRKNNSGTSSFAWSSSDVRFYVTPFLKRRSLLWSTCTFKEGFNLQINKASWIFLLSQFEDDVDSISHWNRSPGFSCRNFDGAELWDGSSCCSNLDVEIKDVSPT